MNRMKDEKAYKGSRIESKASQEKRSGTKVLYFWTRQPQSIKKNRERFRGIQLSFLGT